MRDGLSPSSPPRRRSRHPASSYISVTITIGARRHPWCSRRARPAMRAISASRSTTPAIMTKGIKTKRAWRPTGARTCRAVRAPTAGQAGATISFSPRRACCPRRPGFSAAAITSCAAAADRAGSICSMPARGCWAPGATKPPVRRRYRSIGSPARGRNRRRCRSKASASQPNPLHPSNCGWAG